MDLRENLEKRINKALGNIKRSKRKMKEELEVLEVDKSHNKDKSKKH